MDQSYCIWHGEWAAGKWRDFYFLTNHLKWTAIDNEEP